MSTIASWLRLVPALVLLAILSVTVLAQPRPTDALQIGDPSGGYDILFPATVSQCEAIIIYFNVIGVGEGFVGFNAPDNGPYNFLIRMQLPRHDIGYMQWICNVPAGHRFLVYNVRQYYVNVQGGPSSCLGNITTSSLPHANLPFSSIQKKLLQIIDHGPHLLVKRCLRSGRSLC